MKKYTKHNSKVNQENGKIPDTVVIIIYSLHKTKKIQNRMK